MAVFGEKEWQDHAALIGVVTLAWNRNVHQLLRVFTHLSGVETPLAEAIFFSPQSDSSQRRLIKRVAEAVGLDEVHRKALEKLLNQLDKVSTGRNLAAHIIFGVSAFDTVTGQWGPKVVPVLTPAQDARLHEDFTAQFRAAERALDEIWHKIELWLLNTPYPPRPWGDPPLPLAAVMSSASTMDGVDEDGASPAF